MRISQEKQDKIKEMILSILYDNSPRTLFTAEISRMIARDEEFTKKLLEELQKKGLVVAIKKSSRGEYKKRIKWRLSNKTYIAYKQLQEQKS